MLRPMLRRVLVFTVTLFFTLQVYGSTVTVVSNVADWKRSTTVDFHDAVPWGGVPGSYVVAQDYTEAVTAGALHVANVPGSTNIYSGEGVRYYRTTFDLLPYTDLTADLQVSVDNDVGIYINGFWLALESSLHVDNFGGPAHRLFVAANGDTTNGYLGGDSFDTIAANMAAGNWLSGTNELILAVRNKSAGDTGGFSFAMTVETTDVPAPLTGFVFLAGVMLMAATRRFSV
jgi:hypothetical protein